jgi:hypothetical protein
VDQKLLDPNKHQATEGIHGYVDADMSPTTSKSLGFFQEMWMKQVIQNAEKFPWLIIVVP